MDNRATEGERHDDSVRQVTVAVCTRNRGRAVVATVDSILSCGHPDLELLIIDQSTDDHTRDALAPLVERRVVRYVRSTSEGLSRARNLALEEASNEIVLFTDDDCIVEPDWIDANVCALHASPNSAIVFGDVVPGPTSRSHYVPQNVSTQDIKVSSLWRWRAPDGVNIGIGASMACRRSMVRRVGGFDALLGAGGDLISAEDTDMSLRAVLADFDVEHVRAIRVIHHGGREHGEFRRLTRGAMLGVGAAAGKLLKVAPLRVAWFIVGLYWRLVVRPTLEHLSRAEKPPVLGRALNLTKGLWIGLRLPMDPATARFKVHDAHDARRTSPSESFGRTPDRSFDRIRVSFITEQHVGLKTYSDNLRRFVDHDDRVDAIWDPVTYVRSSAVADRLTFLPAGIRASLHGRRQVRDAISRAAPDVCLFMTQVPAALGGHQARSRPYVIMADDTPILYDQMAEHYGDSSRDPAPIRWLKHRLNVRALQSAYAVLPMSEWGRSSLLDDYGVRPSRAIVIPSGIDLDLWRPPDLRPVGPMRILFVGGDFERKGGDMLMTAFERLEPGSAELHLVTRSPIKPQPHVYVYDNLTANSPELIGLYRVSDVFVLPSRAEAFPNAVMEACAVGLPCIVTDVAGMPEMIVDGECGFVIPVGDIDMLARRLQHLLDSPEQRIRLGRAARERAEQQFDGRVNAKRVVDLMLAAATLSRAPGRRGR